MDSQIFYPVRIEHLTSALTGRRFLTGQLGSNLFFWLAIGFLALPPCALSQNPPGDWSHVHVRSEKEIDEYTASLFQLAADHHLISEDFPKWDKPKQKQYIERIADAVIMGGQIFPTLDKKGAFETIVGLFDLDAPVDADDLYGLIDDLYQAKHDLKLDEISLVSYVLHCKEYYQSIHRYQGIAGMRLVVKNLQLAAEKLNKTDAASPGHY